MPDCKRLLRELSEYIDGELPPELCRHLEQHLSGCSNCRVMLDSLHQTIRLYRSGREEPLPSDLKTSLQATLRRKWRERQ